MKGENCVSDKEQIYSISRGKSKTIDEWFKESGISKSTLLYRLNRGMTIDEAIDKGDSTTNINSDPEWKFLLCSPYVLLTPFYLSHTFETFFAMPSDMALINTTRISRTSAVAYASSMCRPSRERLYICTARVRPDFVRSVAVCATVPEV